VGRWARLANSSMITRAWRMSHPLPWSAKCWKGMDFSFSRLKKRSFEFYSVEFYSVDFVQ